MPVFYYSLQLNVCDFNAKYIFFLAAKGWGGGGSLGLFYCLILSGINNLTCQRDYGWNYNLASVQLNVIGAFLGGNAYK
jgi:hypothetical protein